MRAIKLIGRRQATERTNCDTVSPFALAMHGLASLFGPVPTEPTMQSALATLEHRVSHALKESPHLVRRQLRFEAAEGRVILRGRVSSYFQKQMAQEALRTIEGVDEIHNQLEVDWT